MVRSPFFGTCEAFGGFSGSNEATVFGNTKVIPLAVGTMIGLTACNGATVVNCSLIDPNPYPILITATVTVAGDTLRSDISGTRTVDGDTEALVFIPGGTLAAEGPAGVYSIHVTAAAGTWDTAGIQSSDAFCGGFDPVELTAHLRFTG